MKRKAVIYGVKTKESIHYIGKRIDGLNAEGNMNKCEAVYQYANPRIRNIFTSNSDVNVVPLKVVEEGEWYDEKLHEVVNKHKDNHPLLNAQWMLEGKRGFWEGKTRDAHTLQRLSESKFQKVVQYDSLGNFVRVWDSGKEVGEKVFKDYKVVKGAGETKFYNIWNATTLKGRFRFDSYWFKEQEMRNYFGLIPKKLNLAILYAEEKKRKSRAPLEPLCKTCGEKEPQNFYPNNKTRCKKCLSVLYKTVSQGQRRSTVVWYNVDGTVRETFMNTYEAAYKLKTSISIIQRLCRGERENSNYILKYGKKVLQPENIKYPDYKPQPLKKPRRVLSVGTTYVRTMTRSTVQQYLRGKLIHVFADVEEAASHFHLDAGTIRRICRTGTRPKDNFPRGMYLKLGEKRQTLRNPTKIPDVDIKKIIDNDNMFDDIPL